MVPTSLLASITETIAVSGDRAAFKASRFTSPFRSTGRNVTRYPWRSSHSAECRTAWCSMEVVMMCLRLGSALAIAPLRARLSASVPPAVKTISDGWAPIASATFSRASSSPFFASRPAP
jgi:hypothetical protein